MQPLIVAHRGWSALAPENTLPAYELALHSGADLAECDVHASRDGVAVLAHDPTLRRVAGSRLRVADLSAAELAAIDAGGWHSARYRGVGMPALVDVLALLRGRLPLAIEIKDPAATAGVAAALESAQARPTDAVVFAFDAKILADMASRTPAVARVWLMDRITSRTRTWSVIMRMARGLECQGIGLNRLRVSPRFIRAAHAARLATWVYTVDLPADQRRLAAIGVDALITNRPDIGRQTLGAAVPGAAQEFLEVGRR